MAAWEDLPIERSNLMNPVPHLSLALLALSIWLGLYLLILALDEVIGGGMLSISQLAVIDINIPGSIKLSIVS